ncbi:unnamed protein product [Bathycoccus prasinos]
MVVVVFVDTGASFRIRISIQTKCTLAHCYWNWNCWCCFVSNGKKVFEVLLRSASSLRSRALGESTLKGLVKADEQIRRADIGRASGFLLHSTKRQRPTASNGGLERGIGVATEELFELSFGSSSA